MKKFLVVLSMLLFGAAAFANPLAATSQTIIIDYDIDMANFWERNGRYEQKILTVGHKILYANKINKRIPIIMDKSTTQINAYSSTFYKTVVVYAGILPYIDNDDELAYLLSHEIAHSVEAYGGPVKFISMNFNSKSYELKSDLKGIDYMVAAGYNPIAAITLATKIYDEPLWDWGFTSTHPKGSKRVMAMYKYIYKKYPKYLTSDMTKNINYQNFTYAMEKELKGFHAKEKSRNYQKNGAL